MSKFIELKEYGKSNVLINIDEILYLTPKTRNLDETKTSVMLVGGVILFIDEKYTNLVQRLTK